MDVAGLFLSGNAGGMGETELPESMAQSESIHADEGWMGVWDDVVGRVLGPEVARNARREETDSSHSVKVYTKVPIEECWATTG